MYLFLNLPLLFFNTYNLIIHFNERENSFTWLNRGWNRRETEWRPYRKIVSRKNATPAVCSNNKWIPIRTIQWRRNSKEKVRKKGYNYKIHAFTGEREADTWFYCLRLQVSNSLLMLHSMLFQHYHPLLLRWANLSYQCITIVEKPMFVPKS